MKHAMIALLVFASCNQAHCKVILPDLLDNRLELQQKVDVRLWGQGRYDDLLTGYAFTLWIKGSVYSTGALPHTLFRTDDRPLPSSIK